MNAQALIAALGRDRRLSIVGTDGYVALNAYLPPKERRGVVLIDPPFEAAGRSGKHRARARARAAQMADRNVTCVWRPIREREPTPVFSMRSPRSARQTSCDSNSTSGRGRSARMARSR